VLDETPKGFLRPSDGVWRQTGEKRRNTVLDSAVCRAIQLMTLGGEPHQDPTHIPRITPTNNETLLL